MIGRHLMSGDLIGISLTRIRGAVVEWRRCHHAYVYFVRETCLLCRACPSFQIRPRLFAFAEISVYATSVVQVSGSGEKVTVVRLE